MKKQCKQCSTQFIITQDDLDFYDKVSPVFGWKKYEIPAPTFCPSCRQQRRLAIFNISKLYSAINKQWKKIISPFSDDKWYNIVTKDEWYSDNINWKDFWREYDFNKSFFEQFSELQKITPRWDRISINCENCDWSLNIANSKNCYFVRSSIYAENCYYSYRIFTWTNIVDCLMTDNSINCYELINWLNCSNVFWSEDVSNCSNSLYLFDCENLESCIWCIWLRHKKYYILNKQHTKDKYNKIKNELINSYLFRSDFINKFKLLSQKFPRKNQKFNNIENCSGDEIQNSKNIYNWFVVKDCEDCNYIEFWSNTKDSCDCTNPDYQELSYETCSNYKIYNSWFCFNSVDLCNSFYCETSINLKNCFWCAGLKNSQYCILNKQYTKKEYETLLPKIVEHMKSAWEWWEFFPMRLSLFTYNESLAQEYFPLTKEQAISKGWKWKDENDQVPDVKKIVSAEKLPDNINDIPDDILNWAVKCEVSKRPFKIIPQELKFYREHNIPIPHLHPDERHKARKKLRNPRKLYDRKCMKCEKDIQTTYSPDRSEIIYCEECYLEEVY